MLVTRVCIGNVIVACSGHRQFPQLTGREDLILKLVTEKYQEIVDRHQHRVVDGRAETHLQVLR